MNKSLTVYKEGIFTKIKKFLFNLFNKNKEEEQYIQENIVNVQAKEEFKNNIKIHEDEEKKRILKLQEDYKNGVILEEDISDEDYEKLIQLYEEQNKELREKIKAKKMIIRKKLDSLKVS